MALPSRNDQPASRGGEELRLEVIVPPAIRLRFRRIRAGSHRGSKEKARRLFESSGQLLSAHNRSCETADRDGRIHLRSARWSRGIPGGRRPAAWAARLSCGGAAPYPRPPRASAGSSSTSPVAHRVEPAVRLNPTGLHTNCILQGRSPLRLRGRTRRWVPRASSRRLTARARKVSRWCWTTGQSGVAGVPARSIGGRRRGRRGGPRRGDWGSEEPPDRSRHRRWCPDH